MVTLLDSNVILDLVTDDPKWASWSADALARAADESRLAINPLIFAESVDRIHDHRGVGRAAFSRRV